MPCGIVMFLLCKSDVMYSTHARRHITRRRRTSRRQAHHVPRSGTHRFRRVTKMFQKTSLWARAEAVPFFGRSGEARKTSVPCGVSRRQIAFGLKRWDRSVSDLPSSAVYRIDQKKTPPERCPFFGRSGEARTRGLMVPNHPRYQLRYAPVSCCAADRRLTADRFLLYTFSAKCQCRYKTFSGLPRPQSCPAFRTPTP